MVNAGWTCPFGECGAGLSPLENAGPVCPFDSICCEKGPTCTNWLAKTGEPPLFRQKHAYMYGHFAKICENDARCTRFGSSIRTPGPKIDENGPSRVFSRKCGWRNPRSAEATHREPYTWARFRRQRGIHEQAKGDSRFSRFRGHGRQPRAAKGQPLRPFFRKG